MMQLQSGAEDNECLLSALASLAGKPIAEVRAEVKTIIRPWKSWAELTIAGTKGDSEAAARFWLATAYLAKKYQLPLALFAKPDIVEALGGRLNEVMHLGQAVPEFGRGTVWADATVGGDSGAHIMAFEDGLILDNNCPTPDGRGLRLEHLLKRYQKRGDSLSILGVKAMRW